MARTKASVGAKVSSGKSSKARCTAAPPSAPGPSGSGERSSRSNVGGNPVCPRETPKWQRPITNFFISKESSRGSDSDSDDETTVTNSKPQKRNIITSDDEDIQVDESPKNTVLDETIDLLPLTGENSHKIEEYYPKNGENGKLDKGKGKGKKTNKENLDSNIVTNDNDKRKSVKRDLDKINIDEENEQISKKVKV